MEQENARIIGQYQMPEPAIKIEEREIRCPYCNRLLMKGVIKAIEIKCQKCNRVLKIEKLN